MADPQRHQGGQVASESPRFHRPGFTLIEILVVVAIIALLIAILLPSLVMARNQAQAAHCANNLKQVAAGALMHVLEKGMRRERVSTNFGWATYSFRQNSEMPDIFTCPTDKNPWPMPAVFTDIFENGFSTYHGRVAGCGVFNEPGRSGSEWTHDIQDTVDERGFGRDAGTADDDLLLAFQAQEGDHNTAVRVKTVESAWNFRVYNYKGQVIWNDAKSASGSKWLPLMWMSYGANAAAGLKTTKGFPLLFVENCKPGIFPESYKPYGGRPNDTLSHKLRFRHDGLLSRADFSDPNDRSYKARQSMNGAFHEGHFERLQHSKLVGDGKQIGSAGELLWMRNLWLGNRRGTEFMFD